jgi:hydroxymethylpyrimidine/phosphomethylpyrimidine kinase
MTPPIALTIAATDSGGGAGVAADLATFAAIGVHGTCVVTAVTAQDTTGVHAIHVVPVDIVAAQLDVVLKDLEPAVIKTGMLASAEIVELVADRCAGRTMVVDPVLRASTGQALADGDVVTAYREALIPVATVVTPNEDEWAVLGRPMQAGIVVTTGGDIELGSRRPRSGRIETTNDHGTGCTFASALAAHLALGAELDEAVQRAHSFVRRQLTISRDWSLGSGRGPVAHVMSNDSGEQS